MSARSPRGRVYRRCGCRSEGSRQLGPHCPRLASDPDHGSWALAIDAPCAARKCDSVVHAAAMPFDQAAWWYSLIKPPRTDRRRIPWVWRSVTVAGAIRHLLRRSGIVATIPERRDQVANRRRRGAHGGRPPAFDRDIYRDRNVVERCFACLKQFRAIATRFDKLADRHRAGIVLAALILWLREPAR